MKKNLIFKLLTSLALIAFVAVAVFGGMAVYDLFITGITGGSTLAMAQGFTTETSTTETMEAGSADLLRPTISKNITRMKPSQYPLDTIMREIGLHVPINAWESQWYNIDERSISDTVKTNFAASSGTSALNATHDLIVTNVGNWAIDDNIMVLTKTGSDSKELVLHVVNKDATADKLVVVALNGTGTNGYDLPAMLAGVTLVCIGNAKSEKDARTTPYQAYPEKSYNYAQIHMAAVEQSLYEKLHEKEVNWDINDYRAQSLYNMRRKMELTSLFGVRKTQYDPVGDDLKYFSGGITRSITKGVEYASTSITNDTFAGWGEEIFVGNSGSERRVLFAGSKLKRYLLGVPTISKQIDAGQTETVWGIKFDKIETGFGELLVKNHTDFDNVGWTEKGLVLDVNYLEKHIFHPMKTNKLDLVKAGTSMADAEVVFETFCIATRYPDLHCIISKTSG